MEMQDLKYVAGVLTADCDNPEYCRGICELLANFEGDDDRDTAQVTIDIAREIGIDEHNIERFY